MSVLLQLRSSNSGAPFVGNSDGDTVLWDAIARAWYVGPASGGVTSVFGRVGAVVAATGDYDGDQVDNVSGVPGASVSDALDYLLANAGAVDSVFGRTGTITAASGDYDSDQVDNVSGVSGSSVSDALDALDGDIAALVTGVSSVFGRAGAVAATSGDYDSDQVDNVSGVSGSSVSDALDALNAESTALQTGTNLTNANQTLTTAQRYVMLPGVTSATRTKTLTPPASGRGFQIEIGTQGNDVIVVNGGAQSGGLFTFTVTAGARFALFWVSDGTDVSLAVAMPLGAEPV